MDETMIIQRIKELCAARSWSFYRLAKEAGITYSTLHTLLNDTNYPSIPTLEKLCAGLKITLAEFFDEKNLPPANEQELLIRWRELDARERDLVLAYMRGLSDGKTK